jgi:hypothetical protein
MTAGALAAGKLTDRGGVFRCRRAWAGSPEHGTGDRGGYRHLVITWSRGGIWRLAGGGTKRPGRAPSATADSGEGDERRGAKPDDQDGDIVPGVVARDEPAHPIGAGGHDNV